MKTAFRLGQFDGILILVTLIAISAFAGAGLFFFSQHIEPQGVLWALFPIGLAVSVSLLLALLATSKLWLLMGNDSLSKRLLLVVLVDFIPCAYLIIGFSYAELRLGFSLPSIGNGLGTNLLVAIFTQRLFVWSTFLVMGWLMHSFSHWRITGPIGAGRLRQKFQASIGDIMVLTAFVAGTCGCFKYWTSAANAPRGRRGTNVEDIISFVATASAFEIILVVVFLVLPLFFAQGSAWVRKRFPTSVALWTCFCGSIAAALGFLIGVFESWVVGFSIAGGVLVGHLVFSISLCFILAQVLRAGFQLPQIEEANTGTPQDVEGVANVVALSTDRRRISWPAATLAAAMTLATGLCYAYFDLPILMATGSLSNAKSAATMTRSQWAFPSNGDILSPVWTNQKISYNPDSSRTLQFVGNERTVANFVRQHSPSGTRVSLSVAVGEPISKRLLDELAVRKFSYLGITARQGIDSNAFESFANAADVEKLYLVSDESSVLQSVRKIKSLKQVTLASTIEWNEENAKAIQGLKLKQLQLYLPKDGKIADMTVLKPLKTLKVYFSQIDEVAVQQLSKLSLERISFHGCRLTENAASLFSSVMAREIIWDDEGAKYASKEALTALATQTVASSLSISTIHPEEFEAHLVNRATRTNSKTHISIDCTQNIEADDQGANEEPTLNRLATEIVRNQAGDITEIDLQEVPLGRKEFDQLEDFPQLRRLRIGHQLQSQIWWLRVSELPALRELEITRRPFGIRELRKICKMTKLKRLQLPICIDVDFVRHPETIPFPQEKIGAFNEDIAMSYLEMWKEEAMYDAGEFGYGGEEDPYDFYSENGPEQFKSLANLQELEYLFMPGHLLTQTSFEAIRELPKLRELHAVFSVVDHRLLAKIVGLENLEALSIGTLKIDAKFVEILQRQNNLRTLQVVLFDDNVRNSTKARTALLNKLQAALPKCEVHIIFANTLDY